MTDRRLTGRGLLWSYVPALAVLAAVSLLVMLAPSETPSSDPVAGARTAAGGGERPTEGVGPAPSTCPRVEAGFAPPCPPTFRGDNGGATYRGVTADRIKIVLYNPAYDEQTQSLASQASLYTPEEVRTLLDAWETFANQHFQFYGRNVELEYREGPGDGVDTAQQAADAVRIAVEDEAFLALAETGTPALFDELARREVSSISLLLQFPADYYEEHAPYHFGLLPDLDLVLDHVAEYWCKRLDGSRAVHAGDRRLREKRRKLGVIYSPDFNDGGDLLAAKLDDRCGAGVAASVGYPGDIASATQQAVNIVGQMRDAGVTTVACLCDPVAPVFFTGQATTQGYEPEWLHTGYFATDSDQVGRVYDQQQWAHSFGVSSLPFPGSSATSRGGIAFRTAAPGSDEVAFDNAGYLWDLFDIAFIGIEAAGPDLNPSTFREGLFDPKSFPRPTAPNQQAVSFGSNGPSPYTSADDMMEIWFDPDGRDPKGERGAAFYVDGGRRYALGGWPGTPPDVMDDDGSRQPPPEPDR